MAYNHGYSHSHWSFWDYGHSGGACGAGSGPGGTDAVGGGGSTSSIDSGTYTAGSDTSGGTTTAGGTDTSGATDASGTTTAGGTDTSGYPGTDTSGGTGSSGGTETLGGTTITGGTETTGGTTAIGGTNTGGTTTAGETDTSDHGGAGASGETHLTAASLLSVPQVSDLVTAVSAVVNAHDSGTTDGSGSHGCAGSSYSSGSGSTSGSGGTAPSGGTGTSSGTAAGGTDTSDHSGTSTHEDVYAAVLLPSNNSGAQGAVAVGFDQSAGNITIAVDAHGLTPGEVHPQHIHGFEDGTPSHLPTIANDTDLDGFVEDTNMEAEAAVGPVILSATQSGQVTSAELTPDFPTADANGNLDFVQTYHFDLSNADQASIFQELQTEIAGRAFEIHGLNVPAGEGAGTSGEVNGSGGYAEALPVTGGILAHLDNQTVDTLMHDGVLMA